VLRLRLPLLVALALTLAACGSGGVSTNTPAVPGSGADDASGAPAVLAGVLVADADLPATTQEAGFAVSVTAWDLGIVTLSDGAPAPLRGLAAVPDAAAITAAAGPLPLVVVLHGSHAICRDDPAAYGSWPCRSGTEIRNEEGLRWLLEAFAARGTIAIAPAINVQYTYGAGEPDPGVRTAEIVARMLVALGDGLLPVAPEAFDPARLVLAGHSLGGQDANLLARGFFGFDRRVSGLLMVQPAMNVVDARELADIPTAIVVSECDGDVQLSGARFATERIRKVGSAPVALVVLEGGSHNATNSLLGQDFFPIESPTCELQYAERAARPGGWIEESEEERARLVALLPALLDAVLGVDTGLFSETRAPAAAHVSVVPAGARLPLLPGEEERVIDGLMIDGSRLTWCPDGYYTPYVAPGKEPCHRPELPFMVGWPATIAVAWDREGASVTVPMTGAAGDVLRLRLFPDPADVRLGDGPIVLRLRAQDGSSVEVSVPVPSVLRFEVPPFDLTGGLLPWHTVRVRLGGPLEALTVEVLAPAQGSLQVVSLGID
jgi:hypothetical protein